MQINLNVVPQSNKLSRIGKKLLDNEQDGRIVLSVMYQAHLAIEDMETPEDLEAIRKWIKRQLVGNRIFNRTRLHYYLSLNKDSFRTH